MQTIDKDEIFSVLENISSPIPNFKLLRGETISGIAVENGMVRLAIEIPGQDPTPYEPFRQMAERAVKGVKGVKGVSIVLTASPAPAKTSASPPPASAPNAGRDLSASKSAQAGQSIPWTIAIASGKGGVGKSTTAANLALAFHNLGLKVGLLDADIYGPSLPLLFDIHDKPEVDKEAKKIIPHQKYGISLMSIGFMVPPDTPMIWRGPMVQGALQQLLRDVDWGKIDLLVVDMPPGTGDVQLTLSQQVPLSGAVIVSTPQDLALIDARKGLNMFRKVRVPVLGIVENMSHFICPHCGGESHIFGHGGAKAEAGKLNVPFLGDIPLQMTIRQASDAGTPLMVDNPQANAAQAYMTIAARIIDGLGEYEGTKTQGPKIIME